MPTIITIDKNATSRNMVDRFGPWTAWAKRAALVDEKWGVPVSQYPGVYLLAHFDEPPTGSVDYVDSRIIYVGEGTHLGRRWYQFEQSAYHEKPGHSGGHSYRKKYHQRDWSRLYVAALPIWFGDGDTSPEPWTRNYRNAVERLVLWELTMQGNADNLLNVK